MNRREFLKHSAMLGAVLVLPAVGGAWAIPRDQLPAKTPERPLASDMWGISSIEAYSISDNSTPVVGEITVSRLNGALVMQFNVPVARGSYLKWVAPVGGLIIVGSGEPLVKVSDPRVCWVVNVVNLGDPYLIRKFSHCGSDVEIRAQYDRAVPEVPREEMNNDQ